MAGLTPYYQAAGVTIYHGETLETLNALEFDVAPSAFITDPPYSSGNLPESMKQKAPPRLRGWRWEDKVMETDQLSTLGFVWIMRAMCLGAVLRDRGAPSLARGARSMIRALVLVLMLAGSALGAESDVARQVCSTCHLAPAPESLPPLAWARLLPYMAKLARIGQASAAGSAIASRDFDQAARHYLSQSIAFARGTPATGTLRACSAVTLARLDQGRLYLGQKTETLKGTGYLEARALEDGRHLWGRGLRSEPVDLTVSSSGLLVTLLGEWETEASRLRTGRGRPTTWPAGAVVGVSHGGALVAPVLEGLSRPARTILARGGLVVAEFGHGVEAVGPASLSGGLRAYHGLTRTTLLQGDGVVDVAELEGDRLAVLVAQAREGLLVLEGDRRTVVRSDGPSTGYVRLLAADLDGDGRLDLVTVQGDEQWAELPGIASFRTHGLRVFRQDDRGRFLEAGWFPLPRAIGAAVVDWNRDGRLDVVAVSPTQGALLVLVNEGGFRFTPRAVALPAGFAPSVITADLDGIVAVGGTAPTWWGWRRGCAWAAWP